MIDPSDLHRPGCLTRIVFILLVALACWAVVVLLARGFGL